MASNHREDISRDCYSGAGKTSGNDVFSSDTQEVIERIKSEAELKSLTIGFTCSSFDLLHPGHVIMLKDSKEQCDIMVVGVQNDPTLDRPDDKNAPVQTFIERKIMVSSCRYVNDIIEYSTENDLYNILTELKPNVRILGSDWKGKKYTGFDIPNIKIHWHERSGHTYSTTNLRKRVYHAELSKR